MTRANGCPSARLQRRTSSTRRTPSTLRTRAGAATKPKSRTRRSEAMPASASCASIVPSRPSDWRSGSADTNQPRPWRESIRPSSWSSSSARRTVTRLAAKVSASCASLGRSRPPANSPAAMRPPELGRDLLVADATHLSYTCLHQVEIQARDTITRGAPPWPPPLPPPSSSSSRSTPGFPARAALARERFGRPLTLAEKILVNHLRDPGCAGVGRSSGAEATPTSIPTASRCRTRSRRSWCSSS